ncbi:hypothetical protein GF327_07175 [Candidatus Woesearchaeota archaeon]|nr:hypothetical protein [Candidatus Woesearchaeota archaeon]
MEYFIKPSKAGQLKTEQEITLVNDFLKLMDQRVKVLTKEKIKLDTIIKDKKKKLSAYKNKLMDDSYRVLRNYGLLEFKKIAEVSKKNLSVKLEYEFIAGVKYFFPKIKKKSDISFAFTLGDFDIDNLSENTEKFLENIADLSRHVEADKRITRELDTLKRKVNALKNVILPELKKQKKKISKYLDEKERFDNVIKMRLIERLKE